MTIAGALILGFFATLWWVVGLRITGHGPALVYLPPFVAALPLVGVAWRLAHLDRAARSSSDGDTAEGARRDRLVMWASAVEGVAIFLIAGVVLPSTGHREATVSAIALIVAAHFIPLARGLPAPAYYVSAAALGCLGLLGFGIADLTVRITVVSAGAAIVLWLTAARVLHRVPGPGMPHRVRNVSRN